MSPLLAACLAVIGFAALPAFSLWLQTWRPARARRMLARGALLVDVGNHEEYVQEHLDGAVNVPADELSLRQAELGEHGQPIITYARSHVRGAVAAHTLRAIGFQEVFNIGTLRWARTWDIRPSTRPRGGAWPT